MNNIIREKNFYFVDIYDNLLFLFYFFRFDKSSIDIKFFVSMNFI